MAESKPRNLFSELQYIHNGKLIESDKGIDYQFQVLDTIRSKFIIRVFESQKSLDIWARTTKYAKKITLANKSIEFYQKNKNNIDIKALQSFCKRRNDFAQAEIAKIAKEYKTKIIDKKIILEAEKRKIIDTAILYNDTWFVSSGRSPTPTSYWLCFPLIPYIDLGWFGWRAMARALFLTGFTTVTSGTWYTGSRLFIPSTPFGIPIPRLGAWDRRIISVWNF